jgi:hypothetical protein
MECIIKSDLWGTYAIQDKIYSQGQVASCDSVCSKGRYGNVVGQTSLEDACPNLCAGGKYGDQEGQTSESNACKNCVAGRYDNDQGEVNSAMSYALKGDMVM